MRRRRWLAVASLLLIFTATGCDRGNTSHPVAPVASSPVSPADRSKPEPRHDLSADESLGGHTLARHVGKTDDELRERLRREPDISSASSYTDRATAEAVVEAALASAPRSFDAWRNRSGRRPNYTLRFAAGRPIGRSVQRGKAAATPCQDAVVVLRWDERRRQFYVLTSYPEVRR